MSMKSQLKFIENAVTAGLLARMSGRNDENVKPIKERCRS